MNNSAALQFVWIQGRGPGFADAAAVREQVFVTEQGYSLDIELDATDGEALHLVGYQDSRPVCTGRLFWQGKGVMRIGRVAVLPGYRGGGTGLAVVERLAARAAKLGAGRIVLNAQADKSGFYEKAGFIKTGVTLLDEGVPHVEMEKITV